MLNKRKTTTAIVAGVAAAAMLLGGTFAWTSISQQAKNESAGVVNVGGRLHDDFRLITADMVQTYSTSDSSVQYDKDIYVENFTDPLDGGQPIYARIRLDEYMEVGSEAGGVDLDGDGTVEAVPVMDGTDISDVTTWTTHIPSDSCETCAAEGTCIIHEHWTWTMGNDAEKVYMPTFNKDKDSLDADINGTYAGTNPDDYVYYDDYVTYVTEDGFTVDMNDPDFTPPEGTTTATPLTEANVGVTTVTGTAYYDDDTDNDDNGGTRQETETHTADTTGTADVVLMADWDGTAGDYWVYDTDGWAYWANPIMPGTATGLLLDGFEMIKNPGEKCYYAINVVGQFATAGDWEYFDNWDENSDAAKVMAAAVANVTTVTVTNNGQTTLELGGTTTFTATATRSGDVATAAADEFEWKVYDTDFNLVDSSVIVSDGEGTATLTIASDETNQNLIIASTHTDTGAVGLASVAVNVPKVPAEISSIANVEAGTTTTVTIDEKEWYIVAKENSNALLMAKEPVTMAFDDDSNVFDGSTLDLYLNGTYLNEIPTLAENTLETTITTHAWNGEEWSTVESLHKVYILSLADYPIGTSVSSMDVFNDEKSFEGVISSDIISEIVSENDLAEIGTRSHYLDEWYDSSAGNVDYDVLAQRIDTYCHPNDKHWELYSTSTVTFFPVLWVEYEY